MKRRETALRRIKEMKKEFVRRLTTIQAMRQQNRNQRQGGECAISSQSGVPQEEVQKKPQLGTTQ
jgi:hypothetical protein